MVFPTKISQPKVITLAGKISRQQKTESQGKKNTVLKKIQILLKTLKDKNQQVL